MSEEIKQVALALNPDDPRERQIMLQEREFAFIQRQAQVRASSDIVPSQFRGNVANCVIAMEMSNRLGVGEMEIMQNLYIVHGNPSFSSKYLIALVNKSGILKGRLKFRFSGDENKSNWGCQAYGTCAETEEELSGTTITMAMADAEGWSKKNGSKWKTMPEQMLMYRAASFWSRIYAPDATMGFYTREEAEDMEPKDITPGASSDKPKVSEIIKPRVNPDEEIAEAEVVTETDDEGVDDFIEEMDAAEPQTAA